MAIRSVAMGVVVLVVAACTEPVAKLATVTGQYALTWIDSTTAGGGGLQIGWNTPPNQYMIAVTQPAADSFSASGGYTWDGTTLTLADSAHQTSMVGSLVGGLLLVQRGRHSYEFMRLIELPH